MSGGSGDGRRGGEQLPELSIPETPAPPGGATLAGILGERYQVLSRLGSGAFGEVYRAHDNVLGREVAIKRIRLEAFVDPEQLEEVKRRFLREAQVAARLRHPNIVTTHDIVSSRETSFIVMELMQGRTLQAVLDERGRLSLEETLAILAQVAAALDHAHASQVIHRDVKPANVMVEPSGHVKVMDFGIAKAESGGNLTATGLILGTPNYMSPEQARGAKVDGRSDLFSLGCVLYECLTGVRPFQADSVAEILVRILTEDPPPLDLAATGLPGTIDPVLRRATAKEPGSRFASGGEMIDALRAAAAGSPPVPLRSKTRATAPGAATLLARPPRAAGSRRVSRGLLAAGVVGVACVAALLWIATGPLPRPRPAASARLVVEEPRSVLDRLLGRPPRLRIRVPEGSSLRLVLDQPLSSETAVEGASLSASTATAIQIEGREAVPRASRITGRVSHAASAERALGRGELTLVFESLALDGTRVPLRTRPLAIRAPAPPRKKEPSKRKGSSFLTEVGGAVGDLIGRIKGGSAGSVEGGSAGTVTITSERGRDVTLPAGAALAVELAQDLTVIRQGPAATHD